MKQKGKKGKKSKSQKQKVTGAKPQSPAESAKHEDVVQPPTASPGRVESDHSSEDEAAEAAMRRA